MTLEMHYTWIKFSFDIHHYLLHMITKQKHLFRNVILFCTIFKLWFWKKAISPWKVDMPILTCIFFTFNWLTLTSEMHFVKFHPEVASCLLSSSKRKYAPLGMTLLWKYIWNYFLVYHLISHFLLYLQNYKEFEAEILDLQSEKYGLSFDIKKYTTSGWTLGDENVIGIRAFKVKRFSNNYGSVLFEKESVIGHWSTVEVYESLLVYFSGLLHNVFLLLDMC